MSWFRRSDGSMAPGNDKDKLDDVEFDPSKLKTELESSTKAALTEFSTAQEAKFKPLFDMAEAIAQERADRKKAADDAAARKASEENQVTDEDFLLDPTGATQKALLPTQQAVLRLAAKQAKMDTLGEKEYYYGDVKAKVDAMIAAQPLHMQSRADVLENTYKIVCFDMQKDIADGKIKARNSAMTFEGGSTGAHSGDKTKDGTETLTEEEKFVARKMGISDKDWAASKKELTYV